MPKEKPDTTCNHPHLADGRIVDKSNALTMDIKIREGERQWCHYCSNNGVGQDVNRFDKK